MSEALQLISEELAIFEEDVHFLEEAKKELRKEYGDMFIVIYKKKVVSSGQKIAIALERVKEKGIDVNQALVEFIPKKEKNGTNIVIRYLYGPCPIIPVP